MSKATLDEPLISSFWQKDASCRHRERFFVTIPSSVQDKLTPRRLHDLIVGLADRVDGRRSGVNVARIVHALLGGELGAGAEQAALYQAVRDAVQRHVAALPDLHYVQGLS
jgi:hypothetical protein